MIRRNSLGKVPEILENKHTLYLFQIPFLVD